MTWKRYVDFPHRRTPMQTDALPGTGSIRTCRGTPVFIRDSWKSRRIDLIVSIIFAHPVIIISG
jgi:hypothetical protein